MIQQKPLEHYPFNFKTRASQVMKSIHLTGKTVIVTGGYSGIGLKMVGLLAQAGALVIVPARRPEIAKKALKNKSHVEISELDLIDPESIHNFAVAFLAHHDKLDLLINCAGIMYVPLSRDARGIERHFATNHLGHFQLTLELLPALKKAKNARVITLSSRAQQTTPLLADWNFSESRTYTPQIGYQQSKTANVLFSRQLDLLGKSDGIRAFSVHPGMIPTTNIGREQFHIAPFVRKITESLQLIRLSDWYRGVKVGFNRSHYRYLKTIAQGAATPLWAATSPDLDNLGGLYLEDCNIARVMTDTEPDNFAGGVRLHSLSKSDAERLWEISVAKTGIDYQ